MVLQIHSSFVKHVHFVLVKINLSVCRVKRGVVCEVRHAHCHHVLLIGEVVHEQVVLWVLENLLSVLDDLINESLKRVNFTIKLAGRFCKVKLLTVILAEEEEISRLIIHAVDH